MTKFETETGLRPAGDGRFQGLLSPDWSIVRGANGGHLAAIVLRGMILTLADADRKPRTLTVHFMRVPRNDRIEVEASVERSGRTMTNVSARMVQDDKLAALAIAAFSTERSGTDFSDITMPAVARPEDIPQVPDRPDFPFGHHFDFRPAIGPEIGTPGARVSKGQSDRAELGIWIRLREPQAVDHVVATQLMDAFAPAVFAKLGQGGGGVGVPTVEMTFHYRESLPLAGARSDEWHLGLFRTDTSRGGFISEDGWLWNEAGILVAQSRQLALLQGP
jgi:acyl-CoA thioesterase